MKWKIYHALKADSYITTHVINEIKFYEYPPTDHMEGIYVVVDPLDVPCPGDYADNQPLTDDYLFQVEVWGKDGALVELIAKRIRKILLGMSFSPGSGDDQWDKETKIYRYVQRYEGVFYIDEE
ncbi:hypothetical protein [Rossellomorea marisflavi]|uniref:hypothetical protein n=1 Tax=Rossellomorea marisflavi TaxID=189381 RepID=UPI003457DE81